MKRFLLICLLMGVFLAACSPSLPCDDASCTRVLFIGNSYTYVNDLSKTFEKLAESGGHPVEVRMAAQGGWTLADHAASAETLNAIQSSDWDYVILQEQSQIPSVEETRVKSMYPAARVLVKEIKDVGAVPVFFVTWAHRDGYPEKGMDYETMQARINLGYAAIAGEVYGTVAPVGNAWFTATRMHPELALWQEDGSHPGEQGTYLAASVFYAVIFHEAPEGLSYRANLSKESALILQNIASQVVLGGQ